MVFNRRLKKSFQKTGNLYNSARRGYPKKLIEDIIKISKINKQSVMLDIGCGTGLSTMPFTKKGFNIIAIDSSQDMINKAKNNSKIYKNIEYKTASFEKINFQKDKFDLIVSGTAFHWLNPKIAYKKSKIILKSQGHLSIFWGVNDYNSQDLKKIRIIFKKECKNYPTSFRNQKGRIIKRIKEIKGFEKPIIKKYTVNEKYTKEEFLNLIKSYSWIISLKEEDKQKVLTKVQEIIKNKKLIYLPREYTLIITKKK